MLKITPNINNNRTSVGTVNFTEQQSFFVLLLQFVFTHSFSLICVRHLFLVASLPTYQCLHKTILHFIRLELCLWTYCQSCPGQCVCILGKVTTSTDAIKKIKKTSPPSLLIWSSVFCSTWLHCVWLQCFYDSSSGYCSLDVQRNNLVSSSVTCHLQSVCDWFISLHRSCSKSTGLVHDQEVE